MRMRLWKRGALLWRCLLKENPPERAKMAVGLIDGRYVANLDRFYRRKIREYGITIDHSTGGTDAEEGSDDVGPILQRPASEAGIPGREVPARNEAVGSSNRGEVGTGK